MGSGKILQINGQSGLNSTTTDNYVLALHNAFNNTKAVVNRSFHFIAIKIVGPSEDNRGCGPLFGTSHHNQFIVTNSFLSNLSSLSEHGNLKGLLALQVSQGRAEGRSGGLSNPLEVNFFASANGHGAGLHEILQAEIINTTSG